MKANLKEECIDFNYDDIKDRNKWEFILEFGQHFRTDTQSIIDHFGEIYNELCLIYKDELRDKKLNEILK